METWISKGNDERIIVFSCSIYLLLIYIMDIWSSSTSLIMMICNCVPNDDL